MKTPIYDFAKAYAEGDFVRGHMPGHKGVGPLGCEKLDLTEISGADELYLPEGIIAESERYAAELFGTGRTLYSTEGSSQCICAMLYLARLHWMKNNKKSTSRPVVVSGRNCHKAFLRGAALLDFDVEWLYDEADGEGCSLTRCEVSENQVESVLERIRERGESAAAVYVTSPDYLGGTVKLSGIAAKAHKYGVVMIADNAHGAYLRFLGDKSNPHPMEDAVGQDEAGFVDLCCDSAHKTLPTLTGGAYLHINKRAPDMFLREAVRAMAMFGSTSPSYLILESLDLTNAYIADEYDKKLTSAVDRTNSLKQRLTDCGWKIYPSDPLKLTLCTSEYGCSGFEVQSLLEKSGIFVEYASRDYVVLMLTPSNKMSDWDRIGSALMGIKRKNPILHRSFKVLKHEKVMTIRSASMFPSEKISTAKAAGRILASPSVSCPPAVSVVMMGERITPEDVEIMEYYGISSVEVVDSD